MINKFAVIEKNPSKFYSFNVKFLENVEIFVIKVELAIKKSIKKLVCIRLFYPIC